MVKTFNLIFKSWVAFYFLKLEVWCMNSCTGGVPRGGLWGLGPSSCPQPRSPAAPPGTPPWPDTAPSPAPPSCLWGNQSGPGSPPGSLSAWELGSSPTPRGRHWSPSAGWLVGVAAPSAHCHCWLTSAEWSARQLGPARTPFGLVPPAHQLHHPATVPLLSGPIGVGRASTATCCQHHFTDALVASAHPGEQ